MQGKEVEIERGEKQGYGGGMEGVTAQVEVEIKKKSIEFVNSSSI